MKKTSMATSIATPMDSATALPRRGFLVAMAGAGFALAAQPIMAQTVINTNVAGLTAGWVSIPVANGNMSAYRAQPARGRHFPVVLVVSEIFGVHEWITDICRRLAKLGYLAIAPDLFMRQGDPRKLADMQQIMTDIIAKTPDAEVMADIDATVAWAGGTGGDTQRLGITGFCWGGRITWLYAAHNSNVRAGVAWYGRVQAEVNALTPRHPVHVAAEIKAPVLGLYGGLDHYITQDQLAEMRAALEKAHSASQIHVYPQADHGFLADYRPTYNAEAARDGWQRLQDWLRKNGV